MGKKKRFLLDFYVKSLKKMIMIVANNTNELVIDLLYHVKQFLRIGCSEIILKFLISFLSSGLIAKFFVFKKKIILFLFCFY